MGIRNKISIRKIFRLMCNLEKKKKLRQRFTKVRELVANRKQKELLINQKLLPPPRPGIKKSGLSLPTQKITY